MTKKIALKDYHPDFNDFISEEIEKVVNSIRNSSREKLGYFLSQSMGGYYSTLEEEENQNQNKSLFLTTYEIFYNLARDKAKEIGMDVSIYPKNLEAILN
ncbi:hypothetical protein J4411_01425 [Candidatus Pacearchaeota archaeon]|nr:hypothetical protein [Candidatus Pacearchaeota archaeon]